MHIYGVVDHDSSLNPGSALFLRSENAFPAKSQRNKHVTITPKHHFDVIITCLLRCVFAELLVIRNRAIPAR